MESSIYTGLFFIAIGILVRFFPILIAGYNHLSTKEKENAKGNGLPSFVSLVFLSMGALIFIGHLIAQESAIPAMNRNITVLVTLVGVVVIIVFGQRFTRDR